MPVNRSYKPDAKKIANIIAPSRCHIRDITKASTDDLLETQPQLSPERKWRVSSGEISKGELEMVIPATVQGSYVDPRTVKHNPFHHRPVRDVDLSHIIRAFVQKLSLTQDIVANDHDVTRYATGEWTPTLEDFRYDWTQPTTSGLNVEAVRVITEGILGDFTAGNYLDTALDGTPTFLDLNRKVKSHIRYLSTKINKVNNGDIEVIIAARSKARRVHRRKIKFLQRFSTAETFKDDWGCFLPFLQRVGKDYMSDEESERDVAGAPYLAVRAPEFRPNFAKQVFDALDILASRLDGLRLQKKRRPKKYEKRPAKDGMPSTQPPPSYLPRDCYDARWLEENPGMEKLLQPAPAMGVDFILEGLND